MKKPLLLLAIGCSLMAGMGCHKNEPIPVANFALYHSSHDTVAPDTVTFKNLSQNAPTFEWDFGDKKSSTETNPVHIYTVPGNYDVVLKAFSNSRQQWAIRDQTIKLK